MNNLPKTTWAGQLDHFKVIVLSLELLNEVMKLLHFLLCWAVQCHGLLMHAFQFVHDEKQLRSRSFFL